MQKNAYFQKSPIFHSYFDQPSNMAQNLGLKGFPRCQIGLGGLVKVHRKCSDGFYNIKIFFHIFRPLYRGFHLQGQAGDGLVPPIKDVPKFTASLPLPSWAAEDTPVLASPFR